MKPPSSVAFKVGLDRAGRDRRFSLRGAKAPRGPWADALPSTRERRAAWTAPRPAASPSPRRSAADDEGAA